MPNLKAKCRYKKCTNDGSLDARIEVKTVLPCSTIKPDVRQQFLVEWKTSGEAEFHVQCWDRLLLLSRSRKKKKSSTDDVIMIKEEKALIKAAAEAPEQFDSLSTVTQEAARVAQWMKSAKHCVVFTGAGISTSAGIGDYRGKAGKWTEEDQSRGLDMNSVFDSPAEGDGAAVGDGDGPPSKKSKMDTEHSNDEEEDEDAGVPYEKLRPTYTHEALAKLRDSGYLKYVISQNGDGLHGLSGVPQENISELHGNVFVEKCERCGTRFTRKFYVMDDVGSQYYEDLEDYGKSGVKKPKHAKKCDLCGLSHRTGRLCKEKGCRGHLMDTIINFRDNLEEDILERARVNSRQCDVMLCLGTTLQVTPACDLVKKVKDRNRLVICNRQETPLDGQFDKKGPDGEMKGSRVFGDCDYFMKEVMKGIYSQEDLTVWEAGRNDRMKNYDEQRD